MHACRIPAAALLLAVLLYGCSRTELEDLAPGAGSADGGKPATFSIRLADAPEYNAAQGGTPATRNGEPLLAEWVKVNTFSATRAAEATDEPKIAAINLFEDTVSAAATAASDAPRTRGVMPVGYTLRVIAFWKNGGKYEFQSVADYTSKGSATPELVRGGMDLSVGQTYRFVAYSFNNSADMGVPLSDYSWNVTSISIPDLTSDFMTYDSGDKVVSSQVLTLPVSFVQRLCKLTVKISSIDFSSDTFSNCTGVYVKEGGNTPSWTIGAAKIAANAGNTVTFSIPDNSSATIRLAPFDAARPVTVHFGTLTVGDQAVNNSEITATQSVKLLSGKSYTMTVRFQSVTVNVPKDEITMGKECTEEDKNLLSSLVWAKGNLRQQNEDGTGPVIMAGPKEYGHYYTWGSSFTGNTSQNGIDPCTLLDASKYGAN